MKTKLIFAVLFLISIGVCQQAPETPKKSETHTIDAGVGECTAEFHVTDKTGKPVYSAKVHTLVKYGAFGLKKTELEIYTDSDGRAQITGLPVSNKRPVFFDITKGNKSEQRVLDPGLDCHPKWEVILQ
jgi:hypothetical protein